MKAAKAGEVTQNGKKVTYSKKYLAQRRKKIKRLCLGFLALALMAAVRRKQEERLLLPPEFGTPEYHLGMGDSYFELQMWEQAKLEYQKAVDAEPNKALRHDKLAQTLAGEGRYEEALGEHNAATTLDPDTAPYRNNKGVTLMRMERFEDAEREFRRCLTSEPDEAAYCHNLGYALDALGRHEEALTERRKAVELQPDYAEYHCGLRLTLIVCGQWEEGLSQLQQAAKLDSAYEEDYQSFLSLWTELARKTSNRILYAGAVANRLCGLHSGSRYCLR